MRTVQCAYVVLLFSRMAEPYQTLYTTCSPTHGLYTHGPVQSPSLLYKKCKRLLIFKHCPEVVINFISPPTTLAPRLQGAVRPSGHGQLILGEPRAGPSKIAWEIELSGHGGLDNNIG